MSQILKLITVCSVFFVSACMSKYRSDSQIFDAKVPEGMTAIGVMQILGARGEDSFNTQEIRGMSRPFKFSDINGDGYLSEDEYVGASKHFRKNPRGARGFLRASDNNRDDKVSHEEYIQNRIITDEAKDIYRIQKLLTHKSPQMTQRYAHLRDDALRKASEVMDKFSVGCR